MAKFFKGKFWNKFLKYTPIGWAASIFNKDSAFNQMLGSFGSVIPNLVNGITGNGLTTAQIEQNEWNSQEAQLSRDWQEQMSNTQYQRQVADMKAAGLNPAMMYGGTTSTSVPSGAQASGSSVAAPSGGVLDSLMNIMFAKQRMDNLKADRNLTNAKARAEIMNAYSNWRNATSQERNAATAENRATIERDLANSNIKLNDKQIDKISADIAYINEQKDFISKNYEVAVKNADSLGKQAIAAMRQADAAIQNAVTQSELADYNTDLMYSQTLLNSIVKGEHEEIYKNLPERLRNEIDNLRKQGLVLDEQKRLVHRQGNLATANTIASYVGIATDVARTVASFTNPFGGSSSSSSNLAPYIVGSGASLTF